jgi:hypothetical protein
VTKKLKYTTVGDLVEGRMSEARLAKGDALELRHVPTIKSNGETVIRVEANRDGIALVRAYREVAGRAADNRDLGFLNEVSKILRPMMREFIRAETEARELDIAEAGAPVTSPLSPIFAAAALMSFVRRTADARKSGGAVFLPGSVDMVVDLADAYMRHMLTGEENESDTVVASNGAMVMMSDEDVRSPGAEAAAEALCRALGRAALGKTEGDA